MKSGRRKDETIGENFEIDQKAITIFEGWLPKRWLIREQKPDVFLDYVIEIVENGEPTGEQFGVQLKGVDGGKKTAKVLSFSFKTKHLEYYLKRCKYPVYLFRVDTSQGTGYWLFIQQFLREKALVGTLGKQTKLKIDFDGANNLQSSERFKDELKSAQTYVKELNPGSVAAAIKHQKALLESKDPRIEVSISANEKALHVHVKPKEKISFKIKIRGDGIAAVRDLHERGVDLVLKPGEFETVGLPLGDEQVSEMTFKPDNTLPATLQMQLSSQSKIGFLQINGNVRGGAKYVKFEGGFAEAPFAASLEFVRHPIAEAQDVSLSFDFAKWVGQPIQLLAHFEEIHALFLDAANREQIKVNIQIRGNSIAAGIIGDFGEDRGIISMMDWLQRCRAVARHFDLNPVLPALRTITPEMEDKVDQLYELITNRSVRFPMPGAALGFVGEKAEPPPLQPNDSGILRIDKNQESFEFFGTDVQVGPVRYLFSEMKLSSRTDVGGGQFKLSFKGTPNTHCTIEMV